MLLVLSAMAFDMLLDSLDLLLDLRHSLLDLCDLQLVMLLDRRICPLDLYDMADGVTLHDCCVRHFALLWVRDLYP